MGFHDLTPKELKGLSHRQGAPEAGHAITAFLARYAEDPTVPAADGEAYAYEFRSSSVYDVLEKLRDKFSDERTELEKEEMNDKHSYEKLMQTLQDTTLVERFDTEPSSDFSAK